MRARLLPSVEPVALSRRRVLQFGALGTLGSSLAEPSQASSNSTLKSVLFIFVNGGISQHDSFDLKPDAPSDIRGEFQPIDTATPGIQVCEHLPEIAKWMHTQSVIRSLSTREGDHGRATEDLRTGYRPQGPIRFPVLGSLVSHEHGPQTGDLPNYVSILSRGLIRAGIPPAGFLGTEYSPLLVGAGADDRRLAVDNLTLPGGVTAEQSAERLALLNELEQPFLDARPGISVEAHRTAYARGMRLMSPTAAEAFDLDRESAETHARYGTSQFSQGCLLARRLLEREVPFVEVSLGGWDTHYDNFESVKGLCATLDRPWAALLQDLEDRGLLASTLVVWMGEFGRTPVINPQVGRDHYPKAWTALLGGGAVQGGSVVGSSSDDGLEVTDRPVTTPDFLATICLALGLNPQKQNMSNVGRPIRLVDPDAKPIASILI